MGRSQRNERALADVRTVYAHNQSLAQCRSWLMANLPTARLEAATSNAEAARLATEHEHAAAIASTYAGEIYELAGEGGYDGLTMFIVDQPEGAYLGIIVPTASVPTQPDPPAAE